MIDIHCHTFNGRDVPVVEFGSETVLREMGLSVLKPFVRPLLKRYAKRAPSIREDRENRNLPRTPTDLSLDSSDETSGTGLALEQEYGEVILELKDQAEGRRPKSEFSEEEIDAALSDLASDLPSAKSKPARTSSRDFAKGLSRPEAQQIAAELAVVTREKSTERGGLLAFLANMVRGRVDLTLRAADFAGPAARIRMITPSTNDYDLWYGIEPGSAGRSSEPMIAQVKFAADIALERAPPNVLVNGMVAFDPLRQVYEQVLKPDSALKALDVVKLAVREYGYVGVKLYPPMGYRPTGNAQRDFRKARAWPVMEKIQAAARAADPTFDVGEALDTALDDLYEFCLNEGVAILAHCSNSQSTYEGSGLSANPAYWRQVLEKPSVARADGRVLDYKRLRLNLAHAAAIWCVAEGGSSCQSTQAWRTEMIDMLTAGTAEAPRYPNLCCDIGDADVLLKSGARVRIADFVAEAVRSSPGSSPILTRILYGTDWFMLSKSRGYGSYLRDSSAFFRDLSCRLGDGRDYASDMLWRNAARHLGLYPGGATFKRLKYFYREDPHRSGLLDAIGTGLAAAPPVQTYDCAARSA